MPSRRTIRRNSRVVSIGLNKDGSGGIGSQGLNLATSSALLSDYELVRAERVRVQSGALERAPGAKRLVVFNDNTLARTFNNTAKYATFTFPTIPLGGFGFLCHFVATRPAGGQTAWYLSARPAAVAWHVLKVTLSDAGVITVEWRDSAGGTHTLA